MADEVQRLVAVLEARIDKYEKAFKKASASGDAELARMEKRGAAFAANMNSATARGTVGMQNFAKAASAAKFQTANLASQFQDIAVQLQGGTSPLTIALQQGTQITQVLGPLGARGAVSALGGAFMSLLNPVSLATIGIIGLGGVAVQYLSSLISGADDSADKLKEQAELIQKVADKWGIALPALKAYQDALNEASDAADILKVSNELALKQYDAIRATLADLSAEFADVILLIQQTGASASSISELQSAWSDLSAKIVEGTATAEDAKAIQERLAETFNMTGVPAVEAMSGSLGGLIAMLSAASAEAVKLRNEGALLANKKVALPALGTVGPVYSSGGKFIDEQGLLNARAANTKSQTQIAAGKAARGQRKTRDTPYERETDQIKKKIEALAAEAAALSGLNPLQEDYAYQVDKARVASELLAAAQDSGLKITPELQASIDGLAASYVTATIATRELKDAHEEAMKAAKEFADFSKDALRGFIDDMIAGKSAAEALANVLNKIGSKLLDIGLNAIFEGAGKGKGLLGGLIIPGILHSGGVAGSDGYGHGRAVSPGSFAGAKRYHSGGVAGLRSGEIPAILQRGELVIPKGGLKTAASGQSGSAQSLSINVNVSGARGNSEIIDMVSSGVRDGLKQYDRMLPGRVMQISNDPRRR